MKALRLVPGQLFQGAYRVQRRIGKGSMGEVYLVEALEGGQPYALKVLLPDVLNDERAMERFQREATASQQISSEHLVQTVNVGVDPTTQTPWLLMEYAEGIHLDEFLQSGALLHHQRRAILDQLFRAVSAIHAAGFVHRDLKPENLLLQVQGNTPRLKVLDFGVVKRLGVSPNNSTAQGLGTPLWTAPEQSSERRGLSASADVWALGLLALYVLTGALYWKSANDSKSGLVQLIIEMNQGATTPPSVRLAEMGKPGELPQGFDSWFLRCVARDPALRFQDASEAMRYLEEILDQRTSTMPPFPPVAPPVLATVTAPEPHPKPPTPKRLSWIIVAMVLALALLATIAVATRS